MKPYNLAERNRKIQAFTAVYGIAILLLAGLLYLLLVAAPSEQRRLVVLTQDKIEELLDYTDKADTLVLQIQKARRLEEEKLVPFYKWTNDLKAVYHLPFYTTLIDSYANLVNDLAAGKGKDTSAPELRSRMISLQEENLKLKTLQLELRKELREAKSRKEP